MAEQKKMFPEDEDVDPKKYWLSWLTGECAFICRQCGKSFYAAQHGNKGRMLAVMEEHDELHAARKADTERIEEPYRRDRF